MCGDCRSAWTLKSQFIKGYIGTVLKKSKSQLSTLVTPVLIMTSTSANMNLVKKVYGGIKNRVKSPRGCPLCIPDTANEKNGKQGVIKAIKCLFMSMKKRKMNPIGPLVLEYLKDHASALYEYLSKKKPNEELVTKDLTDDIDKYFHAGFVLH